MSELRYQHRPVHFVNLSMGALDVLSRSFTPFLTTMKEFDIDDIMRKLIARRRRDGHYDAIDLLSILL